MCRAIDAAYEVDEVKDIRDKALAFEVYARQALNVEAERRACEIRLRSERKAGQLLTAMVKAKGIASGGERNAAGHTIRPAGNEPTLADLGISKQQSAAWQKLGVIDEDVFNAVLAEIDKPSTAGVIARTTPPDPKRVPVAADALWLWGRLHDFERDGLLGKEPDAVLLTLTPKMLDDVHRLAPQVAKWLAQIGRIV
jgi:hypothetical protein